MSGIKDTATVTLNVNGAQAKKMMTELESKIKDTEKAISDMNAAGADPKSIEKQRKQLSVYRKQLDELKSSTEGVNRALTNLDKATPRELEKALRTLNRQLKDMTPGTEVWNSHVEKIKELKSRLSEVREEVSQQESLWSRFMDWSMGAWPALDLLHQWGCGLFDVMRGSVDAFAAMDQEMANVRKFTGMTAEQVADLNEEFKLMDTRTSREGLNQLAQEAGRLGKTSKEDVLGFVRAADQINVALDDLGDGATLTLSKLTGVFGDEKRYGTERSLLKVGSVINELSQNCSASAPYLAQFASRMGGVGAQAKMTIPQIMSFGAVLDANGQAVEASATALSQVIVRMMQDPAKYAQVAGLDVRKFSDLLKNDVNEALILFLETLHNAGGMDTLSPMFKDMGENGARAIAALSTLATHIEDVKAQQIEANKAFSEGVSVTNEFNVQNNTVQASIEKAKKSINDLRVELGERLSPLMSHLVSSSSAVVRALVTLVRFIIEHKGAILSLSAAVAAYLVIVNIAIIKQKLWTALCVAGKTAMFLWSAAVKLGAATVALFSGNIRKAHLIWNAFARSLKADSFGLLIAAITAAVGFLITFAVKSAKATSETERLARAQKKIADAEREAEANCAVELKTLEALYRATQDQSLALDQRLNAVTRLQQQYPEYFKNLSQEAILAGNAADAYEQLRQSIVRSAQAEARKELLAQTEKDLLQIERERDRKVSAALGDVTIPESERMFYPMGDEGKESYINSPGHPEFINTRRYIEQVRADADQKLVQLRKERELLGTSVANDVVNGTSRPSSDPIDPIVNPTPQPDEREDRFAEEKAWRDRMEAETKIAYSKGETDHREYTGRMDEIAVGYFSKILERQDLSAAERLETESQYWEAVNRQTVNGNDRLVAVENDRHQRIMLRLTQERADRLESDSMTAEQLEAQQRIHDEAVELAELNHLLRLVDLTKEGSDERLKAETAYQAARLKAQERHRKAYESGQTDYERRIASVKEKYFGDSDSEKKDKFDAEFELLQEVYRRELEAASGNEAEISRIKEAYLAAELAMRREYNQVAATETENSYREAVMNAAQWLKSEGGQVLTGSLSSMTSGMASVFSGLSTMMQAELQVQTAGIESRYEREVELAQGNSYRVAQLEKKKEAEIAKVKNEANRKMFAMQVIQAVAQTAQNALAAFGSAAQVPVIGYILAPIAAAMAVAAGGIQIAAIKKQQQASEAQGYSKGGFTRKGRADEPAGVVHAGEWVASQRLLASPVARPMIEALDYVQRTNTIGSLRAEDVAQEIQSRSVISRAAARDSSALVLAALVSSSEAVNGLRERLDEPFVTVNTVTGDAGIKKAQDEYERLMNNKKPKSKRA